jgi:hypothetical protein
VQSLENVPGVFPLEHFIAVEQEGIHLFRPETSERRPKFYLQGICGLPGFEAKLGGDGKPIDPRFTKFFLRAAV